MSWFEHSTSRVYYEEQGSGDPVLVLPGFAGSIAELAALRDALAASYRVIAADLPGSGRSEPQPRPYTPTFYEDDARTFTALLQHMGDDPAHLIGFSDGGEVVLLMAALTSGVARSVATWGAAGVVNDPDGHLREAIYNIVDNPIPQVKPFRDSLVATYGEANARAMTQSQSTALSAIIERGGELALAKADNIACPVLLIAGEHDIFTPRAVLTQTAARIHGAESLIVEGAGHDVHNARPDWLAHTLLEWLKRCG